MVSKRKKKYSTGEGAQFISRRNALRKLQLSLNDFRRLCIMKGIYPREPRNRKRAQKGAPGIKTLYHVKDIQFLMHEPIIWKLREYKIFNRKVGRAKAIKDFKAMRRYLDNHPTLKLDHIVKERYPTFIDALRDLDDCLTLCFLFSTFPSLPHIQRAHSVLCKRLTMEFLHAIIEAKALRKVFISIKGYYYQAELKGQTITWIVPHHFSFEPQLRAEVDFKIMSTFVEFYTIMLGFVNFRLYHTLNLYYPPKFATTDQTDQEKALVDENVFVAERVAALNHALSKTTTGIEEEAQVDNFSTEDNPEAIAAARKEAESIETLKTLFRGLKFFLNREVPREPLVFIIRCFGGEVSWEKSLFVGATFEETDESITHQIVDRPSMEKKYISRYYIQPQWVFDCVNSRTLLPVSKYFMGEILPPHLSPFVDKDRAEGYVPPEERALYEPEALEQMHKEESDDEVDSDAEKVEDQLNDSEDEDMVEEPGDVDDNNDEIDSANKPQAQKLGVKPGAVKKVEPWQKKREERQEYKLREKMIKKKHRNLYKSMMKSKRERGKEEWLLRKKRKIYDEKQKEELKLKRKQKKSEAVKQNKV